LRLSASPDDKALSSLSLGLTDRDYGLCLNEDAAKRLAHYVGVGVDELARRS
jgi:hypothetical protein